MTGAPAILLPFVLALAAPQGAAVLAPMPQGTAAPAPLPPATPSGPASTLPSAPATPSGLASTLPSAPPTATSPTSQPGPAATQPVPVPLITPPGGMPSPGWTAAPGPANPPQAEPSAMVRPASSATPAPYGYRFVPHQPAQVVPGTPQIFAVWLNSRTLVSKGPIWIRVDTDPATVKVTSSSGGHVGIVPMVAPGDFEAKSTLPRFPFLAGGLTLDLVFTAVGPDGKRTTVSVPVALK